MEKFAFLLSSILVAAVCTFAHANEDLTFDGEKFANQEELDKYKKEKEARDKERDELKQGKTKEDGTFEQRIDDKWLFSKKTSALGDRDTVTIFLEAKFESNFEKVLMIRCRDNETDVMFAVKSYMGSDDSQKIEWKIDDAPISKTTANASSDGRAVFIRNPIAFLRSLFEKKRLAMRVTPRNSGSIEALFDIEGIEKVIGPVEKACNWKPGKKS